MFQLQVNDRLRGVLDGIAYHEGRLRDLRAEMKWVLAARRAGNHQPPGFDDDGNRIKGRKGKGKS
jgi:hypothetical protein